jgi:hypothetical protein
VANLKTGRPVVTLSDWHQSSVFLADLTSVSTRVLGPVVERAKERLWTRFFARDGDNRECMPTLTAGTNQRVVYRHGDKAVVFYYDGRPRLCEPG